MNRRSTTFRKVLTALCAVAMALPAASVLAADPDPEAKLGEVKEQLQDVQEGLEEVERQRVVTVEDLEVIDAELSVLDGRLAELSAELAAAEQRLAGIERDLAVTTSELVATEENLARTQSRLESEREVFAQRTRSSYMHGGPSMASALVEASSLADFMRTMSYVERVIASDRDRVTLVSGLVREIEAQTVDLEVLQDRQAEQRTAAAAERDRVAVLVAEEQEVRNRASAERDKRQLVLNQLHQDRDTYLAMAAELEQESERLEEELRRRAEEEARRAREAEERRLAEERRAAEAARSQAGSGGSGGGTAAPPAPAPAPAPASTGRFQRPSDGRVTSGYGWRTHPIFGTRRMHTGVDFGPGYGAPIYAAESGVVVSASARGGYGNTIIVDHGGGLTTLYAHQSRYAVGSGQQVTRGQVIGYVGSTGNSTGPHLHFEVRVNGATRDPMGYL